MNWYVLTVYYSTLNQHSMQTKTLDNVKIKDLQTTETELVSFKQH